MIFNITWCTFSSGALACGFFVVVKAGLISKPFSKGVNYRLNSDLLSNTTWHGRGYLYSHVMLNNWLTLAYYLYMYSSLPVETSLRSYVSISTIYNQPVAGSIIVLQAILILFIIIVLPVYCCLIDFLYDLSGQYAPNLTVLVLKFS